MNLQVAIDYGISNTDVLALVDGEWRRWSQPYTTDPDADSVRETLEAGGILLERLPYLAVTGGRHRVLPDVLGEVPVIKISEVQAIGRGGQALAGLVASARAETPLLVASAGSGTALIKAQGDTFTHVSGTAVGGGTMLGLARLLLRTMDPLEIEALAERGDRNGADLSLADVITGPIGSLPADATAVNFGRLGRRSFHGEVAQEDLAAALVNLVAQTIALVTVNAAKAHGCQRIVLTGHMLDMATFRHVVGLVGQYYATEMQIPDTPGWATALGALHLARDGRE